MCLFAEDLLTDVQLRRFDARLALTFQKVRKSNLNAFDFLGSHKTDDAGIVALQFTATSLNAALFGNIVANLVSRSREIPHFCSGVAVEADQVIRGPVSAGATALRNCL